MAHFAVVVSPPPVGFTCDAREVRVNVTFGISIVVDPCCGCGAIARARRSEASMAIQIVESILFVMHAVVTKSEAFPIGTRRRVLDAGIAIDARDIDDDDGVDGVDGVADGVTTREPTRGTRASAD